MCFEISGIILCSEKSLKMLEKKKKKSADAQCVPSYIIRKQSTSLLGEAQQRKHRGRKAMKSLDHKLIVVI